MMCQHAACTCEVTPEAQYCSEHCREHGQMPDDSPGRCECGHPECQGTQVAGLSDV